MPLLYQAAAMIVVPSADKAMFCQDKRGTLFENHTTPEFVEIKICPKGPPWPSTAANTLPSADDATDHHNLLEIEVFVFQFAPEFVEVQIYPPELPGAATNLVPSAEQAIVQAPFGAALETQVVPESVVV